MIRKLFGFLGLTLACSASLAQSPVAVWREPATGMEFLPIPKSCFLMGNSEAVPYPQAWPGTPSSRLNRSTFADELPQHEVCVGAMWMGKHEVKAAEWHRIMGGKAARPDAPIVNVTWEQARAFATRLTERSGGKYRFRLPTEAEWEHACRAGARDEPVPKTRERADVAWYSGQVFKQEAQPVGQLRANPFGLHDILGNAWEWVEDSYEAGGYASHGLFDPLVTTAVPQRVIRGASYRSEAIHVRCARRSSYDAAASLETIGFRLVRTP